MKIIPIFIIKVYKRLFASMLDTKCRFYPSCSVYSLICFEHHGFFKGFFLSFWRILRCNPLGKSGENKPPVSKKRYRKFL